MNLFWAELIIEELVRNGVTRCCIAPGSRSSPLTVAAARHAGMRTRVHYDERGSAFLALGQALAGGRPVAWITTSGTAAANGLPAVIEAAQAHVPLILLTADRPPELRGVGANQAIDQVGLFGGAVRWCVDLPTPTEAIDPAYLLTTIDQAVQRATRPPAGPVQLNCMFREPLLPPCGAAGRPALPASLRAWRASTEPCTTIVTADDDGVAAAAATAALTARASRGLIVAGGLRERASQDAVAQLAERLRWPLLPDVTSGLRLGASTAPRVAAYDAILAAGFATPRGGPDCVLHVGGAVTSKRLQQYLEAHRGCRTVRVQSAPERQDPAHLATHRVQGNVAAICRGLAETAAPARDADWCAAWRAADAAAQAVIERALAAGGGLSEPFVARAISRHIPEGHALLLASSMPIRDMDAFGAVDGVRPRVFANRGASGIDGLIATAAGLAAGGGAPVTALLGDLAALHDLNSLALLREAGPPVTLVVVNNNGGGIFSFLPVAEQTDLFEPYFGTPHGLGFEQAAAMFGLPYARPATAEAFSDAYCAAAAGGGSALIEVCTERAANRALHESLWRQIGQRLVHAD